MNNKINEVSEIRNIKALNIILIILATLLPLVFVFRSFTQTSLLKIIMAAVFIALFYLVLVWRQVTAVRFEIKSGNLLYLLVALTFLTILSTGFSLHLYTALWGKYARFEGLFSILLYIAVFFAASQLNWSKQELLLMVNSLVIVAVLISAYAISQYFGFDFTKWQNSFSTGRSFANMGNPVFLGSYLALVFPLSLFPAYLDANKYKRWLYLISSFIILGAIIVTFSRGAWLAAFIGGAAMTAVIARSRTVSWRRMLGVIAMVFIVVFLFGLLSVNAGRQNVNFVEQMKSGLRPGKGSIASRLEIWRGATKIIVDRPLLGYGPDNFALVYPKYKTIKAASIEGTAWRIDNAHNWWLQLAATMGLPALILLLLLFTLVIYYGLNYKDKDREMKILMAALAISLAGYFISLISGISIVGTTVLAWLLTGIIASSMLKYVSLSKSIYKYPVLILYAWISIFMVLLAVGYYKYYRAEGWYRSSNAGKASNIVPKEYYYHQWAGRFNIDLGKANRDISYFKEAANQLAQAIKLNPYDYENYFYLATTEYYLSQGHDRSRLLEAERLLAIAKSLAPREPRIWYELAVVELELKEFNLVERDIERAIFLYKNDAAFYFIRGQVAENKGLTNKAIRAYLKAVELQPDGFSAAKSGKRLEILIKP